MENHTTQYLLVLAESLFAITLSAASLFFFFTKREWTRITTNLHDLRNTMTGIHLTLREVTTLATSISTRMDELEKENKENSKAVARIEGALRQTDS
tara:strand:+ start:2418 stop:2708 length:291 start_codon:yes stop_codon:yes gene_type:complete